ncbi:MAG: 3-deoxy-7-phosphoheptulonate synthase [Cytophagales bacterium]|nr:3-deoxy-7-phosphoheptulonate synthase [Cytophagales bacterium]
MIIKLKKEITSQELESMSSYVKENVGTVKLVRTKEGQYMVCIPQEDFDIRNIGKWAGVEDVFRVNDKHKLVSHKWKISPSSIQVGENLSISQEQFHLIAGPCSIESEKQVHNTAAFLRKQGIKLMRGGAFKPRSSPYSFRGLGLSGLKFFHRIVHDMGMLVVSEILDPSQLDEMYPYVDIFQIGARNSQNFILLDCMGSVDKPVLLKRGLSGSLDELLYSAEYIFSGGNENIILCERGIRTFETAYRNVLDLNAVPYLKERSHLPVFVDPSHGIGVRRFVPTMCMAAVGSGCDGLMIEVHEIPEKSKSDGDQTLNFREFEILYQQIKSLRKGFYN